MFRIKGKLRYMSEQFSLYNKWIRYGYLIFMIFCGLVGTIFNVEDTHLVLLVLLMGYLSFAIWTLFIYLKKMYFIKNGRSTSGVIVGEYRDNQNYDSRNSVIWLKFDVKYRNPYTKKMVTTRTSWMTNCPYNLKSNDVTVYVLEDGRDYVTYFDV